MVCNDTVDTEPINSSDSLVQVNRHLQPMRWIHLLVKINLFLNTFEMNRSPRFLTCNRVVSADRKSCHFRRTVVRRASSPVSWLPSALRYHQYPRWLSGRHLFIFCKELKHSWFQPWVCRETPRVACYKPWFWECYKRALLETSQPLEEPAHPHSRCSKTEKEVFSTWTSGCSANKIRRLLLGAWS